MSAARRARRSQAHCPPGLDPALRRLVDSLTSDKAIRTAAYEAMAAIDTPDAHEALVQLAPAQRAATYLAMRDAVDALVRRKPCDLCTGTARRIRFILVREAEDFRAVQLPDADHVLTGFATLCGPCAGLPPSSLRARLLDRYAALQADLGPIAPPGCIVLCTPVGRAPYVPPGAELGECMGCHRPVWICPDTIAASAGLTRHLVCTDCVPEPSFR
jgi:hypothetical protein